MMRVSIRELKDFIFLVIFEGMFVVMLGLTMFFLRFLRRARFGLEDWNENGRT